VTTTPLLFGASLAAGYFIGARAGGEAYDQLVTVARELSDDVALQTAAGAITGRASELFDQARRRLA
jgi:hypothetical protein